MTFWRAARRPRPQPLEPLPFAPRACAPRKRAAGSSSSSTGAAAYRATREPCGRSSPARTPGRPPAESRQSCRQPRTGPVAAVSLDHNRLAVGTREDPGRPDPAPTGVPQRAPLNLRRARHGLTALRTGDGRLVSHAGDRSRAELPAGKAGTSTAAAVRHPVHVPPPGRRPGARRRPPSRVARGVMAPAAPGTPVCRTPLALLHRRLMGPARRNAQPPPPGTLYASLRLLLALDCLPAVLRCREPLNGQQACPYCLPGRFAHGRSRAQRSTHHGLILPRPRR